MVHPYILTWVPSSTVGPQVMAAKLSAEKHIKMNASQNSSAYKH